MTGKPGRVTRGVDEAMIESERFFYCWLCAQRRLFRWKHDDDGGNWHGFVCNHALWSERQFNAEKKTKSATGSVSSLEPATRIRSEAQK